MTSRPRHLNRITLLLALAPLGLAACGPKDAARPAPPPPKVTVVFPETRDVVEEEDFNGWLAAVESVDIRSRVGGQIYKVHFKDGDIVKAGDPLFTLDQRPFEADAEAARSRKKAYEAQLAAAGKEEVRLKELLGKGGASQKQVEKSESDTAALQAQIASTQSEVDRILLDLEYSQINAPIGGRLSRAMLTEGNLVGGGSSDPVLTTIVSVDPIQVYFDVPERSIFNIRAREQGKGEKFAESTLASRKLPFHFGLETDKGYPREGLLDFAENQVDATTGTIRVRGQAPNADGFLVPGARVRVRVATGPAVQSVTVPDQALQADQDRRYVLVAGPDDKVLRRDVHPGRLLDDGARVLLPSGPEGVTVKPGDRVIIEGQARARIHEPVESLDKDDQPVAAGAAAHTAEPVKPPEAPAHPPAGK